MVVLRRADSVVFGGHRSSSGGSSRFGSICWRWCCWKPFAGAHLPEYALSKICQRFKFSFSQGFCLVDTSIFACWFLRSKSYISVEWQLPAPIGSGLKCMVRLSFRVTFFVLQLLSSQSSLSPLSLSSLSSLLFPAPPPLSLLAFNLLCPMPITDSPLVFY